MRVYGNLIRANSLNSLQSQLQTVATQEKSSLDPYKQRIIDFHANQVAIQAPNTPFKTEHIDFEQGKTNMKIYSIFAKHAIDDASEEMLQFSSKIRQLLKGPYDWSWLTLFPGFTIVNEHKDGKIDLIRKLDGSMHTFDPYENYEPAGKDFINNIKTANAQELIEMAQTANGEELSILDVEFYKRRYLEKRPKIGSYNELLRKKQDVSEIPPKISKEAKTIVSSIKSNVDGTPVKAQEVLDEDKLLDLLKETINNKVDILARETKSKEQDQDPYAYMLDDDYEYDPVRSIMFFTVDPFTNETYEYPMEQKRADERMEFANRYLLTKEYTKTNEFEQDFKSFYRDTVKNYLNWKGNKEYHNLKYFVISAGNTQAQWIDYVQTQIQTLQGYIKNERFTQEGQEFFAKSKELYENILQDLRNI